MTMTALMLLAGLLASLAGMAWLALAMPVHWEQVRAADPLSPGSALALRSLGALALLAALALCLFVDHASMAALVWIMALAIAASTIAMLLSWRPRWLRPFVAWLPSRAGH